MTDDMKTKFEEFFAKNFKDEPDAVLEFDKDYDDKAFVKDKDGYLRIFEIDPEFGGVCVHR